MSNQIVLLGVLVSVLFSEVTNLSPAGLIVPGYIVLCLRSPQRIFYTLAVALLACGLSRLLGHVLILYGRRRFAVLILLSYCIDLALSSLWALTPLGPLPGLIGVLVPGIIASECEKQGVIRSLASLGIVCCLLVLLLVCLGVPVV